MNIRSVLPALLLPILAACGGSGGDTASTTGTGAPTARYQENTHYTRLPRSQEAAENEVVEVFSYGCPACASFQPEVDAWKRERGDEVILRYVPAVFHVSWEPYARAFHAAQELGAFSRLHRAIYNGLYRSGAQPVGTLAGLADIAAGAGIDRQRFLEVAQSPAVDAALERSRSYVSETGIQSTPTLIVSGRYRVQRDQPGGGSPLDVADWLIEHQP